jgi:hypothetical protein
VDRQRKRKKARMRHDASYVCFEVNRPAREPTNVKRTIGKKEKAMRKRKRSETTKFN